MKTRESLATTLRRMGAVSNSPDANNPYRLAADTLCGPGVKLKYDPSCQYALRQVGKGLERLVTHYGAQLHPELGPALAPASAPLSSTVASAVPVAFPLPAVLPSAMQASSLVLDAQRLRAIEAETKTAMGLVSSFLSSDSSTDGETAVAVQSKARSA